MTGGVALEKADLRRVLRERRASLSPADAATASAAACRWIEAHQAFRDAGTIALYAALPGEADPAPLALAALSAHKRLLYPRVRGRELEFCAVLPSELRIARDARWPIPEPGPEVPALALALAELVIVPGLGFTRGGDRLGYGRGFYDRALRAARRAREAGPRVIGLCFAIQVVPSLPATPDDEPVDAVATEQSLSFTEQARARPSS